MVFFVNLKKYQFHPSKIHFLGYVISIKGFLIEEKKIKVVKNQHEPKLV